MTRRGILPILLFTTGAWAQATTPPSAPPPASAPPTSPSATQPAATPASQPATPTVPPPPPEISITLTSGVTWDGLLIRKDDRVITLLVSGIETNFEPAQIEKIRVLPPIEDRYRDLRAAIEDHDLDRLVTLADWLRLRQRYTLALTEVDRVLKLDPEHASAKRLKNIIQAQQDLAAKSAAAPAPASTGVTTTSTPRANFPLLSDRDVALLKVYEVDLARPGRITIPRDAIDALIARYGSNPAVPQTREGREALYKAPAASVLEVMFRAQARDLYDKVKVADLPPSLKNFRDDVNRTWLVNSCATTNCHGGEQAGRLRLTADRPSTDQTALTNMVILDRFRIKPTMRAAKSDGPVQLPLIDYAKPAESPLLTFGLAPTDSAMPHPRVGSATTSLSGWKPAFQGRNDPKFQAAVKWIESMTQPRPTYPIEYTPPEGARPAAPDAETTPTQR